MKSARRPATIRLRRRLSLRAIAVAATAVASIVACAPVVQAGRFLFDATKSEMAGNADWVIDADSKLSGESNPQRIPTGSASAITASTPETYWTGAISSWGIAMVKHGNSAESLPRVGGAITYGSATNAQDLSHYKSYVVVEPNNAFTMTEKQAMLNFVAGGGGLFIVSDHTVSDRDNDGIDSVGVWNDFFTNNGIVSNPFGVSINTAVVGGVDMGNIVQTSTNINTAGAFTVGTAGTATNLDYNNGATFTLSTAANASVAAAVWTNGSKTNSNVMMAYATYGLGRVVVLGDSSPADDGTGDTGDTLYPGWTTGTDGVLISNASDWVNASLQSTYDATTGGSFATAASWTGAVPDAISFVADFKNFITADATITLDRDRTLGQLRFDATHRYTIAGTNTLTFVGSSLATNGITVISGSHTINTPISAGKAAQIDVQPAASVLTVGRLTTAGAYNWVKVGAGRVDFTRIDSTNTFTISAGGMRLINATPTTMGSQVRTLSIATGATLDLGAGALAIDYSGTSSLATIKTYLADGRLKTTTSGLTIGYAEASALNTTTFAGVTVDSTSLLLRATQAGDANLDATVNFDDLLRLASHYTAAGDWSDGDFNYDGVVDFNDLLKLASNYTAAAPAGASASLDGNVAADWSLARSLVPEPTMLGVATLFGVKVRRRRRSSRPSTLARYPGRGPG